MKKYRENRIDVSRIPNEATIDIDGRSYVGNVLDISNFGSKISFDFMSNFFSNEESFDNFKILIDNVKIYDGKADLKHQTGDNMIGLSFHGKGINLDQVKTINLNYYHSLLRDADLELSKLNNISNDFKILVADLNTILMKIKNFLDKEDENNKLLSDDHNKDQKDTAQNKRYLDSRSIDISIKKFGSAILNIYNRMDYVTKYFSHKEHLAHKEYFRENIHPVVLKAPFVKRSYSKPLKYPGDYGLMVMLYEYEDEGDCLFEKFYHRFTCNEPAAQANKNRVSFIADEIFHKYITSNNNEYKIASIACGPAKESEILINKIKQFVPEESQKKLSITCIDSEPKALEYAQAELKKAISGNKSFYVNFYECNVVKKVLERDQNFLEIMESDCIVSTGLFDYLSDALSKRLIRVFYDSVAEGGTILIGNVAKDNPSRFVMSYLGEWELELRDQEDMLKLVPDDILVNSEVDVIAEETCLNIFLRIKKGATKKSNQKRALQYQSNIIKMNYN